MRGFDYLRDTPPDFVEFVYEWRLPRRLYGVATALAAIAIAAIGAGCIEWLRVSDAAAREARADAAFERSRARLASARLTYDGIERLTAIDRALTRMRSSGSAVAAKVVRIGNLVPRGVWLQSIDPLDTDSIELRGEATSIDAIDVVLAKLEGAPSVGEPHLVSLARRARVALAPTVTFELRLKGGQ